MLDRLGQSQVREHVTADGKQSVVVICPAGQEYAISSAFQRFLAEMVDFFILVILMIDFLVGRIYENMSTVERLAVALVYRLLVSFYETLFIWGADGATPGKFLLGLRVMTCATSTLVRPNRILVVPASNVSLSASAVRALIKNCFIAFLLFIFSTPLMNQNFSIAFLFPVFIPLLYLQHNRTVYDIVAGTIVVQHRWGT
ncbi:protein FAM8A1-like [Cololabis saira]|uniref:protein FAM8A1-like n=1 Tax=Cololabis saira TaxID=129043 RepID=UPI002AD51F0A|nr:protein FAM8A1-like [Cololabis saira]